MLTKRIIPCLDVDEGEVVKGIRFKQIRRAGDPVEMARRYADQGADELVFLDIGATFRSRRTLLDVLEKISARIFIPLTAGGGIRSVDDMRDILKAGADKVAVCSAALKNPLLLAEGAEVFGSQCVVLSIDAQRTGDTWHAYSAGGRVDSGKDALEWAVRAVDLGAGEILLNSIDQDGTKAGYDLELTRRISELVSVPVIASGGAGTLEQIYEALEIGRGDAVLLASLLHYGELEVPDIKDYLRKKGVAVR